MPILPVIQHAKGPLPLKMQFNAPTDGASVLVVTGSVWSSQANQLIGAGVELDGTLIGEAVIFSNGASTHRALIPAYIPVQLTFGAHTLTLAPLNSATTSDSNDFFNVVLAY